MTGASCSFCHRSSK